MGRATLIGFSAVAMWALLASLTDASGKVPPFLLSAITFSIGTGVGFVTRLFMPATDRSQKIPPQVWAIGIAGLFGYHFFYFTALRNAPAIEASLIGYLWPLLIVLGSALMPGEKLAWNHVVGALLGLAGTVLIVTKGGGLTLDARYAFGYAMAAICALLWSSYSLLSRRFPSVPTSIVTWFCAATAVLSLVCHLALEQTVLPDGAGQWLAVLGLGLMPVGAAFYAWDIGVKRGNIQVLGAASYAAPLLSTLVLIAAGAAEPSLRILAACVLITGGAALAAKSLFLRKPATESGAGASEGGARASEGGARAAEGGARA
ncbi:EamA family transporter [Mesorhizobium australicum]|uniref:aromatic amino acid exporter YddG n=1 Tax=Mesorhizobium australicum TaxID=536018 RepID=UPI0033378496